MRTAILIHTSCAAALILQAHAVCAAGELEPATTAEVDTVVAEWLTETQAPSVSIAIVRNGALSYAKAYGHAHLESATTATTATRYPIDSVSKEFTAAAALILEQLGTLSLSDPAAKWLPGLGAAGKATLRQLLTHTSGVRDFWPQDFVTPEMMHPTSVAAILDEWVKRPLDFPPGTDWQYSNTGYVVAGAIIEKASTQSLFQFERQNIFEPLHMTHVADDDADPPGPDDASGYTRYGLGPVRAAPKEARGWRFAAAALAMQPSELALWDISLIERALLKPSSYQEELTDAVLESGVKTDYALGLDVRRAQGRLQVGHDGAGSGFLALNRIWPEERLAIVALTNNDWATPTELANRLEFLLLRPTSQEARARSVFAGLQHGRIDRALFTDVGNSYFTPEVLADLSATLGPLGPARWMELEHESRRGGMITRRWKILCKDARLEVIERGFPAGKLEQFLVAARND
jgi:D-alanyl-D-alanine carboxypeptidase